jgi:hypothetical protein
MTFVTAVGGFLHLSGRRGDRETAGVHSGVPSMKIRPWKAVVIGLSACLSLAVAVAALPPFRTGERNAFATSLPPARVVDPGALAQAHAFLVHETRFDAFVALHEGRQLMAWGEADLPINTHSVRKSLLSALYGIAIAKGYLRLDQTLAELGIDDAVVPLTAAEKQATVRDLLMSRSGIYLEAAGEVQAMKDGRPRRGSHRHGEHFYYNNWDFNVLGVIFEQRTGLSIGQALYEWIARPTGMTTFKPEHVIYEQARHSQHRQFVIFMSAADLARFGMLYADGGRWRGQPIIPAAWVEESTRAWSEAPDQPPFDHYGYLWWIDSDAGTAWADGWGGQFLLVDPHRRLALVSRNDTGRSRLQLGWFMLFDDDGWRSHHEQLHRWMIQAVAPAG